MSEKATRAAAKSQTAAPRTLRQEVVPQLLERARRERRLLGRLATPKPPESQPRMDAASDRRDDPAPVSWCRREQIGERELHGDAHGGAIPDSVELATRRRLLGAEPSG